MKNRRTKKFKPYLSFFVWNFREDLFSRITKFVIFREDLISRIAHFEIFRMDLISRILAKFAKTAKFNPREN